MNTFTLKITACDRIFYEGECVYLSFPGVDGSLGVMAHHQPMATVVENGEIRFRLPDVSAAAGSNEYKRAMEKFCDVHKGELKAAERELEIAREQLQQKQSLIEYNLSSASMARAMARLSGARRLKSDDPL